MPFRVLFLSHAWIVRGHFACVCLVSLTFWRSISMNLLPIFHARIVLTVISTSVNPSDVSLAEELLPSIERRRSSRMLANEVGVLGGDPFVLSRGFNLSRAYASSASVTPVGVESASSGNDAVAIGRMIAMQLDRSEGVRRTDMAHTVFFSKHATPTFASTFYVWSQANQLRPTLAVGTLAPSGLEFGDLRD